MAVVLNPQDLVKKPTRKTVKKTKQLYMLGIDFCLIPTIPSNFNRNRQTNF